MVNTSLLILALATPLQAPKAPASIDPRTLIGVWEVTKGTQPPVGSTLELTGDGRFKATIKGQTFNFGGEYRLEGDQLTLEPPGSAMTVKELTATTLRVAGPSVTMEYRRLGGAAAARAGAGTTQIPMPGAGPRAGGAQPGTAKAKGGPGRWPVVKTEKGDFTVEMPTAPFSSGSGHGDGFENQEKGAQTKTMDWIVVAYYSEDAPDAERIKTMEGLGLKEVAKYGNNLKVLSETPAQMGGEPGREYHVTLERFDLGLTQARARTLVKGKAAYIVMALSREKDKDLPPETARFLDSFTLKGSTKATSPKPSAAPSPTRAGNAPATAWGTVVDPDGDVIIRPSARSLTMEIPGTPHLLAPERGKMNAPRVVSPVAGDFVATVRVEGQFRPSRETTMKSLSPREAAGLLLWKDPANYLSVQHRASMDDGKLIHQVVLEELVSGSKGVTRRQPLPDGPVLLRLTRQGGKVTAFYSSDGREWKDLKPVDTTWAEGEARVGVVAVSTSTGAHPVKFEGYHLEAR